MHRLKALPYILYFISLICCLSGCAGLNKKGGDVSFNRIGGFADRNGQAKILIITYTGEPEKADIGKYVKTLGCGMIFAYYYPDAVDRNLIPVQQLASAVHFGEAQDLLFKGEGVARWQFASQCLGMIPTLTDCRKSSISTNCR